jgi:hypothetical protein
LVALLTCVPPTTVDFSTASSQNHVSYTRSTSNRCDSFRMNTSYGRYGATYNMGGLLWFNDEELLLLPKNPTEAKLQAMSTRGESTEPTKGVMKQTYRVVLYNYCLMQYFCTLFYQLVRREGSSERKVTIRSPRRDTTPEYTLSRGISVRWPSATIHALCLPSCLQS